MKKLPTVYVVQASDALQHAARLHEILKKFVAEQRISGFQTGKPGDDFSKLAEKASDEDLIVIMLTEQLEPDKDKIETALRALQQAKPDLRISEIIVDNVVYDNEFITFPVDLKPIRDRLDMDTIWSNMEESLKKMFPAKHSQPVPWKKYIAYAAIAAAVILLFIFIPRLFSGGAPEVSFSYFVGDNTEPDTLTEFYPPVDLQFINESQGYDSCQWTIGDSVYNDKHIRMKFVQPGKIAVSLAAFRNGKKGTYEKTLLIKQPPVAAFEIQNNGCTAPCQVSFNNTSKEAESFQWDLGNGQTSSANQPTTQYATAGSYTVTLVAKNKDGITAETKQTVTAIPDDAPFADFTYTGNFGTAPRNVKFTNKSKNADSYVWQFSGGNPQASSAVDPSIQYQTFNTYAVTLTAKKNDGRSHSQTKTVRVGLPIIIFEKQIIKNLDQYKVLQP